MIWLTIGLIGAGLALALLGSYAADSDLAAAAVLAGVVLFVGGLIAGGITAHHQWDIHHQPGVCASYGETVGREVRFVKVSYWNYDCYVHTSDGWLPKDQVRKVEGP